MSVPIPGKEAADAELRALLRRLKDACGASYEKLAERAAMSRGAVQNYLVKPGHRRDAKTLKLLLAALDASEPDRDRALELHRQTLPGGVDPAEVGWAARARAAQCTMWEMAEFTATSVAVRGCV